MVFLVIGWSAKNIKEKKKTDRRKTLKSEEKEKRRIWGKSNNNNFGFKLYFAWKHNLKKSCLYHFYTKFVDTKFYLQFLCVAGHLKHSNDTPNLNIHRHTNYNIIKIYINRLSTTTPQIFIAMDYLKRKKYLARTFFTNTMEITGSMYFGNIFRIMYLPKICTKT